MAFSLARLLSLATLRARTRLSGQGDAQSRRKSQPSLETLEQRCLLDTGLFRSIDGTGNNLAHPEWGSVNQQLLRIAPDDYGDKISTPAGSNRPSAREISNTLAAHVSTNTPDNRDLTAYLYVWGQFLDHDLDLTSGASPSQAFNISVPTGDTYFDPSSTGTQVIPLTRSIYDPTTGTSKKNPREQINQITAWIDGSMIYGSDTVRAAALRSLSGGKLLIQDTALGDLPPLNTAGFPNANDAHRAPNDQLFLAGDVRANENVELTAMHTLFIREHNRLADHIAAANPGMSDEDVYQRARALVIAEIQVITYKEWLPALLGPNALTPYTGYKSNVNPGIANEFSTAAFRLHTTINDDVEFFDNNGRPITFTYTDDYGYTQTVEGSVALFDAFFNPTMFKQTGVDGMLKYAASTHAERLDNQLVDSLRNFLFGPPGAGGLDLASLNIQRGRDHGLADYHTTRVAYGLPKVNKFSDITSDPALQEKLKQLYHNVNNIDLWVGAMAEDHVPGASTGPLIRRILSDQFQRLRDGDRFWYQNIFSGAQLAELEATKLSDIIERNSNVTGLQDNVFFFKTEVNGQVFKDANGNGVRDGREAGLAGVQVQLLNDEGSVIASVLTDRQGRYRFGSLPETGDFQVQVVVPNGMNPTTENPREILISSGDVIRAGEDFGLRRATASITIGPSSSQSTASSSQGWLFTSPDGWGNGYDDFTDLATALSRLEDRNHGPR